MDQPRHTPTPTEINLNREALNKQVAEALKNPLSVDEYNKILTAGAHYTHGTVLCTSREELLFSLQTLQSTIGFDRKIITQTVDDFDSQMAKSTAHEAAYGTGISFKQTLSVVKTPQGLGFASTFTTSFDRNQTTEQPLVEIFQKAKDHAPQKNAYLRMSPEAKVKAAGRIEVASLEDLKALLLIARDHGHSQSLDQFLSAISTVREFHQAAQVVYEQYGENVRYGAFVQLVRNHNTIDCIVGWDVRLLIDVPQPQIDILEATHATLGETQARQMLDTMMHSRVSYQEFQTMTNEQKYDTAGTTTVETVADLQTLLNTLAEFQEYQYLKNPSEWQRVLSILEHEKEHYVDAQKIRYATHLVDNMRIKFGLRLFTQGMFVPYVTISYSENVPARTRNAIGKMVSFAPTEVSDLDIQYFHRN